MFPAVLWLLISWGGGPRAERLTSLTLGVGGGGGGGGWGGGGETGTWRSQLLSVPPAATEVDLD